MWDYVWSKFSIVKQFHILSFFNRSNMYFVLYMPESWFSKLTKNCVGADVLTERGVVCISQEQLDHYFVWNTQ